MTGHNSQAVTGARIRSFIERVERLEEEIKSLNEDKKQVFAEAKGEGFDVKTLKRIIQTRRKDPDLRAEEDALFQTYMDAIEGASRVHAHVSPEETSSSVYMEIKAGAAEQPIPKIPEFMVRR